MFIIIGLSNYFVNIGLSNYSIVGEIKIAQKGPYKARLALG